MPLLGKEEFPLQTLPPNLKPNVEVFYCNITGEAFQTYDEYFERQILCSSLFWTCSVTGKTNLTYLDAVKSERESQTLLSTVPRVLQKVLLHLMKYMDNFSTNIVLAIILEYTNLRYFIGENVQVMSSTSKHTRFNGYIRDVIPPEDYDATASIAYGIDPLKYQYSVEIIEHRKRAENKHLVEIVPASRISRPKTMLTREKLRLFLKQHLSPKSGRYDTLNIKPESVKKYGLDHLKWEDIFKGPVPNFNDDTTLLKAYNKRASDVADLTADPNSCHNGTAEEEINKQIIKKRSSMLTDQKLKRIQREEKLKQAAQNQANKEKSQKKSKKQKLKEKAKLKASKLKKKGKKEQAVSEEAAKEISKEDKLEQKKKIKEARRKFEEGTRSWLEKRDDLLCDDLQKLPTPTPVVCDIDINLVGDSLVILEFLNIFKDFIIDFPDTFQPKISLEIFAQILNDTDVTGPYSDLLQILLKTILLSHRSDEEGDLNINKATDDFIEDDDASFYNNNYSNSWVSTYYGTQDNLAKLKVDAFTLSEILRIYLLKVRNSDLKRSRHSNRQQDVTFAIKLTTCSVFEFKQVERIALFKLLLNDLVKLPDIRQKIEDSMEEIFRLKTQMRHLNASFTKWLRDNPIRQRIRKKKQSTDDATNENKEPASEQSAESEEASQAEKEQYKKEKNLKEQQMKKSISELKAKIRKLSAFCRPRPLGMDRAYRRYWVFQSIAGLLVEHSIEDALAPRPCLESPLPMTKPQLTDYLPNAKKRKRKNKKEENAEESEMVEESNPVEDKMFEKCTGDPSNCSVHGATNVDRRVQWAFYTKDQFEELIEALNSRGYRENELKNSLNLEKNSILKKHLENFVPTELNPSWKPPALPEPEEEEEHVEENFLADNLLRKSERIQNQNIEKACTVVAPKLPESTVCKHLKTENKYSKLPPTEAHQVAFQEELLELEDKIYHSCFTSISENSRDDWAKKLNSLVITDEFKAITTLNSLFRALAENLKSFCLLPPLSVIPDHSASSPSDKENIEHVQPKIPKLSEKWLESLKVADCLRSGRLSEFEPSFGITNLSQLFINLYIFEKSINWELSAMKTATKCRVCRRKANDEMILCDMCNRGFHIYCLKPPIRSIDDIEGDWFCYTCAPRSTTAASKKNIPQQKQPPKEEEKPHSYNEDPDYTEESLTSETDENELEGAICRSCRSELFDEYNEVYCKSCNRGYHLSCAKLLRVPRSWACRRCEANERYNNDHSEENGDLRRSTRKRKPNLYYDEPSLDESYTNSTGRPKRYALNGQQETATTTNRMQRI